MSHIKKSPRRSRFKIKKVTGSNLRKWCVNIYPETRNGQKYTGYSNSNCFWIIKKITQTYTSVISEFHWKWCPLILLREMWKAIALDWVLHTSFQQNKLHQMELLMQKLHVRKPKLSCYPTFPESGEWDQPTPEQVSVPSMGRKAALLEPLTRKPPGVTQFSLLCIMLPPVSCSISPLKIGCSWLNG